MNRWVGIVSSREPVHRIALAVEAARKRTSYSLGGRQVSYERMRRALRRVGRTYAARSESGRSSYCVDLAGGFFAGRAPAVEPPRWLVGELRVELDGEAGRTGGRTRPHSPHTARPGSRRPGPSRPKETTPGEPGRTVPARPSRTGRRPMTEPPRPYVRVQRQRVLRDVIHPPLDTRSGPGKSVKAAVRNETPSHTEVPDAGDFRRISSASPRSPARPAPPVVAAGPGGRVATTAR